MKETLNKNIRPIISLFSGWLAKIAVRYILIIATLFFGSSAVSSAEEYGFSKQTAIEVVSSVVFLAAIGLLEKREEKDKKLKEDTIDKLVDLISNEIKEDIAEVKLSESLKPEQKKVIKKIKKQDDVV